MVYFYFWATAEPLKRRGARGNFPLYSCLSFSPGLQGGTDSPRLKVWTVGKLLENLFVGKFVAEKQPHFLGNLRA